MSYDELMDFQKQLFRIIFLIRDHMQAVVHDAESNLTVLQILILRTLVEEKSLTQNELGKILKRDKAQITRLVQDLVEKKLILKTQNKLDKRSFNLTPSSKVESIVNDFMKIEYKLIEQMVQNISAAQIKMMNSHFRKMLTNIS